MKLLILIFVALPVVFIAIGGKQILEQKHKLTSYVETEGRIVAPPGEVKVKTSSGRNRSTTYTPVVRYRYEVGGNVYRGERVFPVNSSARRTGAYEIVAQHPVGKAVKVHHDPADPGQAFLIRRWDFGPYMFVLFPMIHFAIGIGLWASGVWRTSSKSTEPVATSGGWYELPTKWSIRKRRGPWAMIAAVWFGVGGAACAHYFMNAPRPYATEAVVVTPIYLALGLIPLIVAARFWSTGRSAADAKVFVNKRELSPGDWFNVRAEQAFYRHLLIEGAKVGLALDRTDQSSSGGKSRVSTTRVWEDWGEDMARNEQASPAHPLTLKRRLTIPSDQPPTSDGDYPRHAWKVVVKVRLAGAADYSGEFPVQVKER
jgi:hypothetical protein